MKKAMTWFLVLVMCVLPFGAMAEGTMDTLSFGNVTVSLMGQQLASIGAMVNLAFGCGENGNVIATIDAVGGGAPIGKVTLSGDDRQILVYVDGMTNAYAITMDELKMLGDVAIAQAADELGESVDMAAFQNLLVAYAELIAYAADPANEDKIEESAMKALEAIGVDLTQQNQEEVTVLGETLLLNRYELVMNGATIDRMYDIMSEENEVYAKFWSAYKQLAESVLGVKNFSFETVMSLSGAEFYMPMTVWTDETEEWVKMDMQITVAVPEEGEITIPYVIEAHEADGKTDMELKVDMSEMGASLNMTMNATETESGEVLSMSMDMLADGEEVHMTLGVACEEVDGRESVDGSLKIEAEGEEMALTLSYLGDITEKGDGFERSGVVKLGFSGMGMTGDVSFDLMTSHGPLDEAMVAQIQQKPVVSILEAIDDEALAQQVMQEGQTVLITALGALMQTPGMAEIIADFMFGEEDAGYDDYGYGDMYLDYAGEPAA